MSSNRLLIAVVISVVLGIVFGLLLPGVMLALSFVGQLFVNVLKIVFVPLVAAAIITGISSFKNNRQTVKAVMATISLFVATTVAALLIGVIVVSVIQPGAGMPTGAAFIPEEISQAPLGQSLDFLSELIPSNIFNAVSQGKFLGWMIALIIAAILLAGLGRKNRPVVAFFETIYLVVQKVLGIIIAVTPVGVFFLVGDVIARNGGYISSLAGNLLKLSITLLIAFAVHALLVIPLLLKLIGGRSPLDYFRNVFGAVTTALASASPTAALAITYENSVERNKVDSRTAALVLPLGSSINVDGRAMYVVIAALFLAQAYGVSLGFAGVLYVAAATLLLSLGTATVPFAGMLTLVAVFDAVGFPSAAYAGIGLLFVIDWFWGRIFAGVDVWSDTAAVAVVEELTLHEATIKPRPRERTTRTRDKRPAEPRRQDRRKPVRKQEPTRPDRRPAYSGRAEREPVPTRSSYKRRGQRSDRQRREKPLQSRSPFELKPESVKAFDPETARATDKPAFKPVSKQEEELSLSESGRIMREKIHHQKTDGGTTTKPPDTTSKQSVSPPPLIREMEKPEPAQQSSLKEINESKKEPPVQEIPKEQSAPAQFGRSSQRKGPRPKSDQAPAPAREEPEFSAENQQFGRGRKKKSE